MTFPAHNLALETQTSPLSLSLDLGSGPCPAAGYVGLDLCAAEDGFVVQQWDLLDGSPWPFDDESCERLHCSHFIEHIPQGRIVTGSTEFRRVIRSPGEPKRVEHGRIPTTQNPFFWFFDEAFRIAKPGCRFELRWPHPQSDEADQDPTHCRRIPAATLHYLSREGRRTMNVLQYPVGCDWRVEHVEERATEEKLAPFMVDGAVDVLAAKRAHGVFHEIYAVLVKP